MRIPSLLAATLLALLPMLSACGSSPSSPSPEDFAGIWQGTRTLSSASPSTHALAQLLNSDIGASNAVTVTIANSGEALTITITDNDSGLQDRYSGVSDGDTFTASVTYSDVAALIGVLCPGDVVLDVAFNAGTMTGTLDGGTITGTIGETYQCYLTGTSTSAGIVTANGTFSISE